MLFTKSKRIKELVSENANLVENNHALIKKNQQLKNEKDSLKLAVEGVQNQLEELNSCLSSYKTEIENNKKIINELEEEINLTKKSQYKENYHLSTNFKDVNRQKILDCLIKNELIFEHINDDQKDKELTKIIYDSKNIIFDKLIINLMSLTASSTFCKEDYMESGKLVFLGGDKKEFIFHSLSLLSLFTSYEKTEFLKFQDDIFSYIKQSLCTVLIYDKIDSHYEYEVTYERESKPYFVNRLRRLKNKVSRLIIEYPIFNNRKISISLLFLEANIKSLFDYTIYNTMLNNKYNFQTCLSKFFDNFPILFEDNNEYMLKKLLQLCIISSNNGYSPTDLLLRIYDNFPHDKYNNSIFHKELLNKLEILIDLGRFSAEHCVSPNIAFLFLEYRVDKILYPDNSSSLYHLVYLIKKAIQKKYNITKIYGAFPIFSYCIERGYLSSGYSFNFFVESISKIGILCIENDLSADFILNKDIIFEILTNSDDILNPSNQEVLYLYTNILIKCIKKILSMKINHEYFLNLFIIPLLSDILNYPEQFLEFINEFVCYWNKQKRIYSSSELFHNKTIIKDINIFIDGIQDPQNKEIVKKYHNYDPITIANSYLDHKSLFHFSLLPTIIKGKKEEWDKYFKFITYIVEFRNVSFKKYADTDNDYDDDTKYVIDDIDKIFRKAYIPYELSENILENMFNKHKRFSSISEENSFYY